MADLLICREQTAPERGDMVPPTTAGTIASCGGGTHQAAGQVCEKNCRFQPIGMVAGTSDCLLRCCATHERLAAAGRQLAGSAQHLCQKMPATLAICTDAMDRMSASHRVREVSQLQRRHASGGTASYQQGGPTLGRQSTSDRHGPYLASSNPLSALELLNVSVSKGRCTLVGMQPHDPIAKSDGGQKMPVAAQQMLTVTIASYSNRQTTD